MASQKESYVCVKDKQLQVHSRKLERLEALSQYREQRIDELNDKINGIDKKLDKVLEGFNDFRLDSNAGDASLELRLKAMETKIDTQEKVIKDYKIESQRELENNRAKTNQLMAVITIIFAAISLYMNFFRF